MIEKKIGRYISFNMGCVMSICMSFVGTFLGSVFFSYILPKFILGQPINRPVVSVVLSFLLGLIVSLIISFIIAQAIGFIVPMKKINDSIEKKMGKKGFVTHVVQSLVSDLLYTILISLTMAFVSSFLFTVKANEQKFTAQIAGVEQAIAQNDTQIEAITAKQGANEEELAALQGLFKANEALEEQKTRIEATKKVQTNPVVAAFMNFGQSFPFEFIIAFFLIFIFEPVIKKKAFKKYIPNYNSKMDEEEI